MTADPAAAAHCPTCGTDYRAGVDLCADDGTPLVPGPGPEPQERERHTPAPPPPPQEAPFRWIAVSRFPGQDEARLLIGRLEAEGIPARIFPDPQLNYYGRDTISHLGQPIEVLVPEHRVVEARVLIEELERTGARSVPCRWRASASSTWPP